uniref:SDR family oxidoreductase n=1 Tax=Thermorudis peleae TaxID=1382356 RepID=A0A831X7M5_9BACT
MIDPGLEGKVAIVTGANHGIGAAAARALAAQGVAVLIHYLRLPAEGVGRHAAHAVGADAVVQAIRDAGGRAEAFEADLADPATVPALFDRAEAAFGPVEILVNNAAHWEPDTFLPEPAQQERLWPARPLPPVTAGSHDRSFAVNSRAVALLMAEFASRHIARGARWGRIVNVGTGGSPGFAGEVSYGASKHALESYSRAAAAELGRYGITVNIVSPGPIQTGWITPELEERIREEAPLGRVGRPEDVADVVVFFASEQARWLTGQLLHAGGGHRMW